MVPLEKLVCWFDRWPANFHTSTFQRYSTTMITWEIIGDLDPFNYGTRQDQRTMTDYGHWVILRQQSFSSVSLSWTSTASAMFPQSGYQRLPTTVQMLPFSSLVQRPIWETRLKCYKTWEVRTVSQSRTKKLKCWPSINDVLPTLRRVLSQVLTLIVHCSKRSFKLHSSVLQPIVHNPRRTRSASSPKICHVYTECDSSWAVSPPQSCTLSLLYFFWICRQSHYGIYNTSHTGRAPPTRNTVWNNRHCYPHDPTHQPTSSNNTSKQTHIQTI